MKYLDNDHGGGKGHECGQKAWTATNPSDAQNAQARENFQRAKAVYEEHKEGIHQAMQAMHAAWVKHPIVKDEVKEAGMQMHHHMMPVKVAVTTARIDTINLLSLDQREIFNRTMMDCMGHP
jgi:uncharacterized protein with FMN-binding domain